MQIDQSIVVYILLVIEYGKVSSDDSSCSHGSKCVPLAKCSPEHINTIIYPCHSDLNLYCCPSEAVKDANITSLLARKKELFPTDCGITYGGDKITGGETADLGQFPWMALLGYKQEHVDIIEFLCGGTLITENYVLTAAHCLGVGASHELISVRLGEHDLESGKDCGTNFDGQICSNDPVDVPVEDNLVHPDYNSTTLKNDIAIVRLERSVQFTKYIQPICLPFESDIENKDLTAQKFAVSGWGKTNSKNVGGSSLLQYAFVTVWNQSSCNVVIPPEVQPISPTQLCANGKKEDACKGDSGGPLSNTTVDTEEEFRTYQIGIVSFAPRMTCGVEELPSVYTRVDKYLKWIVDSIK